MANPAKSSQIDSLIQQIESHPNFALVKYEKTTHTTLESLRKQLKTQKAKITVLKNTLFEKALRRLAEKNKHLKPVAKSALPLKENTALLVLGEDWSAGLKSFSEFSEKEKSVSFKVGILENQVYDTENLEKIAKLPGKDQLVAQLIGSMKSPISHFTYALKFNMTKLVFILNAQAKKTS
jgi:large subunit ribosomal protein L10